MSATFDVKSARERPHRTRSGWASRWTVKVTAHTPCGDARGTGTADTYQAAYTAAVRDGTRNASAILNRCARSGRHAFHSDA